MGRDHSTNNVFSFHRSSRGLERIVALLICLPIAAFTTASAMAVAAHWIAGRNDRSIGDVIALTLVAGAFCFATLICVWGFFRLSTWSLSVDGESVRWKSGRREVVLPCQDIVAIDVKSPSESADSACVRMRSGERIQIPALCLGRLHEFLAACGERFPHIALSYNHQHVESPPLAKGAPVAEERPGSSQAMKRPNHAMQQTRDEVRRHG